MTPRELLNFSARMRTTLSSCEIEKRVESLITALKLEECQDQMVGTDLVKGISGGERKRTSIGYELITNPSLLFLDEPTSGLDSFTAL
jgi:ABC-type multidrug transport system ATPase subunit